mmetsp:Transcript_91096/g.260651  ORF Transcript_91096/g.260651 Transcript_91096/m.260651 type:complete len:91 (+) Transcript_91096:725-997(+)
MQASHACDACLKNVLKDGIVCEMQVRAWHGCGADVGLGCCHFCTSESVFGSCFKLSFGQPLCGPVPHAVADFAWEVGAEVSIAPGLCSES